MTPPIAIASRRIVVYNDPRVPIFVAAMVGSNDCKCHSSLGVEQHGRIVAGVVFDNYSEKAVFMHFSKTPEHVIGRRFLRLLFGYAFEYLKVERIIGACSSANVGAMLFAEKLGFKYETKLQGIFPTGDLMFYSMIQRDCKFLGRKV